MARRREHPAVQAAMERTGITREVADTLMRTIDRATLDVIKAAGFESFRFDARLHPEDGYLTISIKMRPVGR